jgi:cytochrome P450 family 144
VTTKIPGTLLLDPEVIEDPYPFYRRLQAHAPVWRIPDREVFTVSSFALLAEAVARVDAFSSNMRALLYRDEEGLPGRLSFGEAGVDALATADPPDHKMHRDVVFSELVAKRMAALEPEIADTADRCLGRALESQSFDFMAEIGNIVPITLISRLIGFPSSDLDMLLRAAFDSTSTLGATSSLSQLNALVARIGEIEAWIANQVSAAVGRPDDDILGAVARGVDIGIFTLHQATVVLHTLLSAGGESTTSLLGNAVRLLAEDGDLQDRLRGQLDLVPAFIEEALRLESPFRFLMRFVPETTSLGNIEIPGGATMLLLWGAANRDPAEFDEPNEVDLDRPVLRRHVAFGRGMHYCVGAPLARLEARVVLGMLLERTSSITLDAARAPKRVESLMVRRHEQLPVRMIRR